MYSNAMSISTDPLIKKREIIFFVINTFTSYDVTKLVDLLR